MAYKWDGDDEKFDQNMRKGWWASYLPEGYECLKAFGLRPRAAYILARNGVKSVEALSRLTTAEIRMWPNVGAKALEALAFDLARVGVPLPGATVKQPSPCYRLDDPALRKALISLGWTPPE